MNKEKVIEDNRIFRAKITASENSDYDFECVAVPVNNGQLQYMRDEEGYRVYDENWNPKLFNQVLLPFPENVNTDRLESGLPLFDNHPEMEDISILTTLGITTAYEFTEAGLVVRCKFGARADQALRDDVKNGIIKTVSIEGSIQEYGRIEQTMTDKYPNYFATMWTPESLSFAPVPNDIESQISAKRAAKNIQLKPTKEDSFYKLLTNKF